MEKEGKLMLKHIGLKEKWNKVTEIKWKSVSIIWCMSARTDNHY